MQSVVQLFYCRGKKLKKQQQKTATFFFIRLQLQAHHFKEFKGTAHSKMILAHAQRSTV